MTGFKLADNPPASASLNSSNATTTASTNISTAGTNITPANRQALIEAEQKAYLTAVENRTSKINFLSKLDEIKSSTPINELEFDELCKNISKLPLQERKEISKHTDALGNSVFDGLDGTQKQKLIDALWNKDLVKALSGVYSNLLNGSINNGYDLNNAMSKLPGDMSEKVWTFDTFCKNLIYKNQTVHLPTWNEFFPGISSGKQGFGNGLSPVKAEDGSINLILKPRPPSPWSNN